MKSERIGVWVGKSESTCATKWKFFGAIFMFVVLSEVAISVQAQLDVHTSEIPSELSYPLGSGIHEKGWCSMYDLCGARQDGKPLNCPKAVEAVTPSENFSHKVQSLCPTITGDLCCTEEQFDLLRQSVQQAVPFLVGCPACLRNFLNLFCELSCSPDQSCFIDVTATIREHGRELVDGIDFYITEEFGGKLYDSCKDVKFAAMNTRAMDFIGAGAKNYSDWFSFMGHKAGDYEQGSPYQINFKTSGGEAAGMQRLNVSVAPCWDSSLSCSCGDCPSASFCSEPLPPPDKKNQGCNVHIGQLQMGCLELGLGVLYAFGLLGILIWWLRISKQDNNRSGQPELVEPLLISHASQDAVVVSGEASEIIPAEVHENGETEKISVRSPFMETWLSYWFRVQGLWIARHPGTVLVASIFIVSILCAGLYRLEVETQPEKLWVSPGSKAAEEKAFFDMHLAPFYRIEQLIIATRSPAGESSAPYIVTDKNLLLLFEIQEKVDAVRGNASGTLVSLQDICTKPTGTACATQSILQYFQMDNNLFYDYNGASHAEFCFEHSSSSAQCLSAFQGPVDPGTVLGGFSGTNYTQATALVISYPVQNFVGGTNDANDKAITWEKAFIKLAKEELTPMVQAQGLTLAYTSEYSVEAELKRESSADVVTVTISYLVMFIYISFVLGDYAPGISPLYMTSKALLGLAGVVIVALCVLGSIGLFSFFSVKSTLIIVEVIPFLVLAVGVDNMCILVHAVKRQDPSLPVEARVGEALSEVGPSITLASLSEILAFAVGIATPMPACRVFSMFAAVAVLLDFLLQVTAFVALLTYDLKRTESARMDCFPCFTVSSTSKPEDGVQARHLSILTRYMKEIHGPMLSLPAIKATVLAVFAGLFLTSIALVPKLSPGLDQKVALPRDSYLQGYFDNITEYLRVGPPVYFVVRDYNYSTESNNTNLLCSISHCDPNSFLNEVSRAAMTPETSFIARPAASWLDDFMVWLSPDAFGCCRTFSSGSYCPPDDQPPCCLEGDDYCTGSDACRDCTTCFLHSELTEGRPSTKQFQEKLPWFLEALPSADCAKGGRGAYSASLDLKGYESGIITASEFRTYHTPLNEQSDYVDALRAAKEFTSRLSESLKIDLYPYSVFYIFFEQYLDIWRTTAISLLSALGAVFLVSWSITSSIWTSSIVILVLSMIIVDLMGVMVLWGIQLNALSIVNLVMSVGIGVEFCIHITHSFSTLRVACSRNSNSHGTEGQANDIVGLGLIRALRAYLSYANKSLSDIQADFMLHEKVVMDRISQLGLRLTAQEILINQLREENARLLTSTGSKVAVEIYDPRSEKMEGMEKELHGPQRDTSISAEWGCKLAHEEKNVSKTDLLEERRQRLSRSLNLIIIGVNDGENSESQEDLVLKVNHIMKLISAPFDPAAIYRIGAKRSVRTRPVLVKFKTLAGKKEVWNRKTKLRGTQVYFKEDLTPSQRATMREEIKRAKEASKGDGSEDESRGNTENFLNPIADISDAQVFRELKLAASILEISGTNQRTAAVTSNNDEEGHIRDLEEDKEEVTWEQTAQEREAQGQMPSGTTKDNNDKCDLDIEEREEQEQLQAPSDTIREEQKQVQVPSGPYHVCD